MSGGPDRKNAKRVEIQEYRRNRRFWERIIVEKYNEILAIARSFTNDISTAYDLAQTVILRLLKYSPAPASIASFDAYIFTSTRNAWIDSQGPRREISITAFEQTSSPEIAVTDSNLNNVNAKRDLELVTERLHVTDRKLLTTITLLRAGEKLPDIADTLGESVRTTKYRYYRWRNQIMRKLQNPRNLR